MTTTGPAGHAFTRPGEARRPRSVWRGAPGCRHCFRCATTTLTLLAEPRASRLLSGCVRGSPRPFTSAPCAHRPRLAASVPLLAPSSNVSLCPCSFRSRSLFKTIWKSPKSRIWLLPGGVCPPSLGHGHTVLAPLVLRIGTPGQAPGTPRGPHSRLLSEAALPALLPAPTVSSCRRPSRAKWRAVPRQPPPVRRRRPAAPHETLGRRVQNCVRARSSAPLCSRASRKAGSAGFWLSARRRAARPTPHSARLLSSRARAPLQAFRQVLQPAGVHVSERGAGGGGRRDAPDAPVPPGTSTSSARSTT